MPVEEFSEYLRRYSETSSKAGAQILLVTPIPALGGVLYPDYNAAMLAFARKNDIPCFDLGAAMTAACAKLGPRRSALLYQPDGVHLTAAGAEKAANLFARLLRESADPRLALLRTVFGGRRPGTK